jgi:hypothetical protein
VAVGDLNQPLSVESLLLYSNLLTTDCVNNNCSLSVHEDKKMSSARLLPHVILATSTIIFQHMGNVNMPRQLPKSPLATGGIRIHVKHLSIVHG